MSEIILRHSYSALKQYENCPKRYYLQRITKAVKDVGGEASIHGDRVHKDLEARVKDKVALPASLAEHEPTVVALETLALRRGATLEAEVEITINDKYHPTGWWDDDAWLRSKIDVLMCAGSDAVILDWKTGKRRPDFTQMDLFALMVFLTRPQINRVVTSFYWLPERASDKRVYTRDEEGALIVKLTTMVTRIEKSLREENWPAKPSGLCRYCPANKICEFAA